MNKNAIKKYAISARRELIDRVSKKAMRYGIAPEIPADPEADSVDGRLLSNTEKKQRAALIEKVAAHGYEQTMEEAAYTWFNRFAARDARTDRRGRSAKRRQSLRTRRTL